MYAFLYENIFSFPGVRNCWVIGKLYLLYEELPDCFAEQPYHFPLPLAVYKSPGSSASCGHTLLSVSILVSVNFYHALFLLTFISLSVNDDGQLFIALLIYLPFSFLRFI